jgi:hypothetical protein
VRVNAGGPESGFEFGTGAGIKLSKFNVLDWFHGAEKSCGAWLDIPAGQVRMCTSFGLLKPGRGAKVERSGECGN